MSASSGTHERGFETRYTFRSLLSSSDSATPGPVCSSKWIRGRSNYARPQPSPFILDAPASVLTAEQHDAHVRCSLAAGIAEAILRDEPDEWKKFASSLYMGNARHHRKKLGTNAKSWEQYTDETCVLVRKHWAMIEAVAKALKEKGYLHAHQVESICNRVARRQHVKDMYGASARKKFDDERFAAVFDELNAAATRQS